MKLLKFILFALVALSTYSLAEEISESVPESSSDSTAISSSSAESSSSGEGLVLVGEKGSDPKNAREVRRYRSDEVIYRHEASVGLQSPSRGMVSFEYFVIPDILNLGIHFTDYNDEIFQMGLTMQYYPMELRYFYMFFSNDWITGKYERERKTESGKYREYDERENFWRVAVGIGTEIFIMEHFGFYLECGFEFFAGDGSYFLHLNKKYGELDNDNIKIPYGFGFLFPF